MHWFYFALLAAVSESLKNLCSKQGLRAVSPQLAALAASATPIPLLLGILLFTDSIPALGPQYVSALLLGGTLNVLALFQFMRALQASDMSLAIPFISFTPIFLLFHVPLAGCRRAECTRRGWYSLYRGRHLPTSNSIDTSRVACTIFGHRLSARAKTHVICRPHLQHHIQLRQSRSTKLFSDFLESLYYQCDDGWIFVVACPLTSSNVSHFTHQHTKNPYSHRTLSRSGAYFSQYGTQLRSRPLRHRGQTIQHIICRPLGHHVFTRAAWERTLDGRGLDGNGNRNIRIRTKRIRAC